MSDYEAAGIHFCVSAGIIDSRVRHIDFFLTEDARLNLACDKAAIMDTLNGGEASLGTDGNMNGGSKFFATGIEDQPWWQVDLGAVHQVSGFELHNRSDCCMERAASLVVQVSKDGQAWTKVYSHDKKPFGSDTSDTPPLRIRTKAAAARFVRIHLAERNYPHLSEVRVLGE